MMTKLSITLFLLCLLTSCGQKTELINTDSNKVSTEKPDRAKSSADCELMNFRFLVVNDYEPWDGTRKVEVFLDKREFSESNLKKLFSKISKKYAEATSLIIIVNTDWEQLSMPIYPADCPGMGSSERNGRPEKFEFHEAGYYRRGENEYFRHNPTLGTANFKKVILNGDKIYENGQWQKP